MSIYTKLAQIQSAVRGLTKNQTGYNYTYVDGNKVFEAIRPMMCEAKILLAPEVIGIKNDPITYQKWDRNAKQMVPVTEVLCTIQLKMNWIDADTGETFSQQWSSTGMNGFDKGFGSALTYGERYYLLKFFHIPTDRDDVDRVASDREKSMDEAQAAMVEALRQQMAQASQPKPVYQKPGALRVWPNKATYDKLVENVAYNKMATDNETVYDFFVREYKPTDEALRTFNDAVAYYRVNHNI